ncbi:MAG: hypothetical protein ACNI25_15765 [Halarcobacter sp.]
MKIYLYAKSGHAIGLDATRRCSAFSKFIKEYDPILCTCDFRAGAYAKEVLGIKKYVSVDILSNLPNIMQRGDILIYDSDEASEFMQEHMKEFCTLLYKFPEDIPYTLIDEEFFYPQKNQTIEKLIFFGDDDYNNLLLDMCEDVKDIDIPLLWGHYFFLGNEKLLADSFNTILEEEEYINSIQSSKFLLSASLNGCIESIACGNKAVLLKRDDKVYDEEIINKLNLPTIKTNSITEAIELFDNITKNYPKINQINKFDISSIKSQIAEKIELYKKLSK